jgi:hypothetical protein
MELMLTIIAGTITAEELSSWAGPYLCCVLFIVLLAFYATTGVERESSKVEDIMNAQGLNTVSINSIADGLDLSYPLTPTPNIAYPWVRIEQEPTYSIIYIASVPSSVNHCGFRQYRP